MELFYSKSLKIRNANQMYELVVISVYGRWNVFTSVESILQ